MLQQLLYSHFILPLVMEFVSEKNNSRWVSDAIEKHILVAVDITRLLNSPNPRMVRGGE